MLSTKQIWPTSIALVILAFVVVFGGCWVFSMAYHGILPFLLKSIVELKVWHALLIIMAYITGKLIVDVTFMIIRKMLP
jgi:hypothetical protein